MICKPCRDAVDRPDQDNADHPGCTDKMVSVEEDGVYTFRLVKHAYRSCDCQHQPVQQQLVDVALQGTGE